MITAEGTEILLLTALGRGDNFALEFIAWDAPQGFSVNAKPDLWPQQLGQPAI
jgi:hypothetical protein